MVAAASQLRINVPSFKLAPARQIVQTNKKEVEKRHVKRGVRKWVVTSLRGVRIIFAHVFSIAFGFYTIP